MKQTKTNLTLLIFGLMALVIGLSVFNYNSHQKNITVQEQLQHATYLYDQQVAIPKFNFIDQHGQAFTHSHIQDQWTLWFFGFTHCPDICPMIQFAGHDPMPTAVAGEEGDFAASEVASQELVGGSS